MGPRTSEPPLWRVLLALLLKVTALGAALLAVAVTAAVAGEYGAEVWSPVDLAVAVLVPVGLLAAGVALGAPTRRAWGGVALAALLLAVLVVGGTFWSGGERGDRRGHAPVGSPVEGRVSSPA